MTLAVILSTLNGEKFLRAQLDSLIEQDFQEWVLLWRDDGSNDATRSIMAQFRLRVGPERCREIAGSGRRMGVAASYRALVAAVPEGYYAAFADQDDVWFPHKLTRALHGLAMAPTGCPALYCARQQLTNAALVPQGLSPPIKTVGFPGALTHNIATGCTVVLNPGAVRLMQAHPVPSGGVLHDWWAYMLLSAAGGYIHADNEAVLLYRQHSANVVGAASGVMQRACRALRRGRKPFMSQFRTNIAALQEVALPACEAQVVSQIAQSLHQGWYSRLRLLCKLRRLRRQTLSESMVFWLWFVCG